MIDDELIISCDKFNYIQTPLGQIETCWILRFKILFGQKKKTEEILQEDLHGCGFQFKNFIRFMVMESENSF